MTGSNRRDCMIMGQNESHSSRTVGSNFRETIEV